MVWDLGGGLYRLFLISDTLPGRPLSCIEATRLSCEKYVGVKSGERDLVLSSVTSMRGWGASGVSSSSSAPNI